MLTAGRSLLGMLALAACALIPGLAAAAGGHDRSYIGGFVHHRGSVVLQVDKVDGELIFRRFEVGQLRLRCSDGTHRTLSPVIRDRVKLDDERRFRSEGRAGDRDDGVVKRVAGEVGSSGARGGFRMFKELRRSEGIVCETRRLKWTAQRIGPAARR